MIIFWSREDGGSERNMSGIPIVRHEEAFGGPSP
jgi:hypothetical protein